MENHLSSTRGEKGSLISTEFKHATGEKKVLHLGKFIASYETTHTMANQTEGNLKSVVARTRRNGTTQVLFEEISIYSPDKENNLGTVLERFAQASPKAIIRGRDLPHFLTAIQFSTRLVSPVASSN